MTSGYCRSSAVRLNAPDNWVVEEVNWLVPSAAAFDGGGIILTELVKLFMGATSKPITFYISIGVLNQADASRLFLGWRDIPRDRWILITVVNAFRTSFV